MATVSVRYVVHDVDAAIEFYCSSLGFEVEMHPAAGFAMLSRGDLRLLLSAPGAGPGGGGRAMPDGRVPEPGGWNRFQLEVSDLAALVETLRGRGATFRNDIVDGRRRQADPARRPLRQPGRALRADPAGSGALTGSGASSPWVTAGHRGRVLPARDPSGTMQSMSPCARRSRC